MTNRQGMTTHEAVSARGRGIPAINVRELQIDAKRRVATYQGLIIHEFDYIVISANELCWALSGAFEPTYGPKTTYENISFLAQLLTQYRIQSELAKYDTQFQIHIANLMKALRRAGIKIESTIS